MAWILALLGGLASKSFIQAILTHVLVALGVSVVSYLGIDTVMDLAMAALQSQIGGLPADVGVIVSLAKVPQAMSVVCSAGVARMTMSGLVNGGVMRRITWASNGPIVLN